MVILKTISLFPQIMLIVLRQVQPIKIELLFIRKESIVLFLLRQCHVFLQPFNA